MYGPGRKVRNTADVLGNWRSLPQDGNEIGNEHVLSYVQPPREDPAEARAITPQWENQKPKIGIILRRLDAHKNAK